MLYGNENFYMFKFFVDFIMIFSNEVLVISLTFNCCVLLYACGLKIQEKISKRCCCTSKNLPVLICQAYNSKSLLLAKIVVEQLSLWIVWILAVVGMCLSDVIIYPFSGNKESPIQPYVLVFISINIGRFIYLIIQDVLLIDHIEKSKFRTSTVHHLVVVASYLVFVMYQQNLLMALAGMTMEINSSIVEGARIYKEVIKRESTVYKRIYVLNCVVTILFRGVVPISFLVIAMLQQTPFIMNYPALTMFFLSLIFFSVVNVWFILASIKRTYLLIKRKNLSSYQLEEYGGGTSRDHNIPYVNMNDYTKNNLGYVKSYDNKNLTNNENEKINCSKKEFPKDNLAPPFMVKNNFNFDRRSHSSSSSNSVLDEPCSLHSVSADVHNSTSDATVIDNKQNELRDSIESNTSSLSSVVLFSNERH